MKRLKVLSLLSATLMLLSCGGSQTSSTITSSSEEQSSSLSSESSESLSSSESSSSKEQSSSSESQSSSQTSSIESSSIESSSQSSAAEPTYKLNPQDETLYDNQHYLNYVGNIQNVWNEYRGDGVTVAVIDTGFDINHTEFFDENGKSKISDKSASFALKNGSVTVSVGKDNVIITDGNSHGTICATVLGASVTGEGTVGIAPNCNLLLLKTDAKPRSIEKAFRYAADNGARAITISIGSYYDYEGDLVNDGSDLSTVFEDALKYAHDKGVVICSAAGNGGECGRPTEYTYPGASSYVIGAGGLADRSRTSMWSGSSYNSSKDYQFCDVFAPAKNLYSGCSYIDGGKQYYYNGGFNGTSFASPIIAGAAALYFQKHPEHTNTDFETALFNTCNSFGDSNKTGYGAINIESLIGFYPPECTTKYFYFKTASWWKADGAKTSAYLWNYALTKENSNFPGVMMYDDGNGYFHIEIDTLIYDLLIFVRTSPNNEFWGAQTINIHLSSFGNNNCYDISNTTAKWTSDNQFVTGTFAYYNV